MFHEEKPVFPSQKCNILSIISDGRLASTCILFMYDLNVVTLYK